MRAFVFSFCFKFATTFFNPPKPAFCFGESKFGGFKFGDRDRDRDRDDWDCGDDDDDDDGGPGGGIGGQDNDGELEQIALGDGDQLYIVGEDNHGIIAGDNGDDTLIGADQDDFLLGNHDDDVIKGMGGDDTLHGGQDDDTIYGGAGDDVINGSMGNDLLYGNEGADTFEFKGNGLGDGGFSTIADFEAGIDSIAMASAPADVGLVTAGADVEIYVDGMLEGLVQNATLAEVTLATTYI